MFCVCVFFFCFVFFFQAEDGIRVAQESRGLGDVYKRQGTTPAGLLIVSVLFVVVADVAVPRKAICALASGPFINSKPNTIDKHTACLSEINLPLVLSGFRPGLISLVIAPELTGYIFFMIFGFSQYW